MICRLKPLPNGRTQGKGAVRPVPGTQEATGKGQLSLSALPPLLLDGHQILSWCAQYML